VETETRNETEGIATFFFCLEALKKDLVGSCRLVVGVASIGVSNSFGEAANREELPEP
jgi:hypothetical protein